MCRARLHESLVFAKHLARKVLTILFLPQAFPLSDMNKLWQKRKQLSFSAALTKPYFNQQSCRCCSFLPPLNSIAVTHVSIIFQPFIVSFSLSCRNFCRLSSCFVHNILSGACEQKREIFFIRQDNKKNICRIFPHAFNHLNRIRTYSYTHDIIAYSCREQIF